MVISPMLSIDEQLNSVVVELNRTLLQYAFECWPYAREEAGARIRELALAQQRDVGVLCDVLLERQWPIDFGTYPTDYTALQYNSLASLVPLLVESQTLAIDTLRGVADACSEDAFISEVLSQLLDNESKILDGLKSLPL